LQDGAAAGLRPTLPPLLGLVPLPLLLLLFLFLCWHLLLRLLLRLLLCLDSCYNVSPSETRGWAPLRMCLLLVGSSSGCSGSGSGGSCSAVYPLQPLHWWTADRWMPC
jgi:hypothetical protein